MRKEVLLALCAVCLLVAGATMANAATITWTVLSDASVAGLGPGTDNLIGHGTDSTSGQNNNCNFNGAANCDTAPAPTVGVWSFVALELPQTKSCVAGTLGDPCTSNADCGSGGWCIDCPENPSGWDTYSYMGNIGQSLGNGTLSALQCDGNAKWTSIKLGSTESIARGMGATCINLRTSPSPNFSACGVGGDFTSTANVKFSLGCNPLLGAGQIDNLQLNGHVYATSGTNTDSNCGYTSGEINTLRSIAAAKGGGYLLVMCGNTAIPDDSSVTSVCLRGADVWDIIVAYTAADATNCADACSSGGGCMAGTAEGVE